MSRHGKDENDTADIPNLSVRTKIDMVWLSGACWRWHHSYIPHPHHILHPKSPLLTPPWLILRPGAVIPEPYSSTGPWLFFFHLYLTFPQHLPAPPLSGWHHRLWQENKSVSDRCRLASERRPWQLSIKSPRLFFFFFLLFFNLRRQTLESCCQHNGSILARLAPPGPAAPRPVPSL